MIWKMKVVHGVNYPRSWKILERGRGLNLCHGIDWGGRLSSASSGIVGAGSVTEATNCSGDQDFASRTASGCLEFRRIEIQQAAPRASRAPLTLSSPASGARRRSRNIRAPPRLRATRLLTPPVCLIAPFAAIHRAWMKRKSRVLLIVPPHRETAALLRLWIADDSMESTSSKEQAFNSVANIVSRENKRKREAV